jgi:DNA (cytosine-5)-methyltransferase 1
MAKPYRTAAECIDWDICRARRSSIAAPACGQDAGRIARGVRKFVLETAQGQKHALCVAYLAKHYGGNESTRGGSALDRPIDTVTAVDHHSLVVAFLTRYNGTSTGQTMDRPLSTIDTRDRFGLVLVTINGETFRIDDIAMRMLTARELFKAQGFPETYKIAVAGPNGKTLSDTAQKRMCGNAVSPYPARELIAAQFSEAA